MANITEIVVAIEATGVDKVLTALKQVDGAQTTMAGKTTQLGTTTKNATDEGGNALVNFGRKWQGAMAAVTTAAIPIYAAVKAVKVGLEFTQEGAQLDFAATKFDNLAGSIGATGSVLLSDLREASRGVTSDFDLMGLASSLMAMRLAKTPEDVVRLTAVAGAMNMDMSQLTLTLTNMSKLRLDQLGLSVESVTGKFEEFKKAGTMTDQEAWFQAVVGAGEEAIGIVGHVADTDAGAWARMTANQKTYMDNMKKDTSGTGKIWADFWGAVYGGQNVKKDTLEQFEELRKAGVIPQEMLADYQASLSQSNTGSALAGMITGSGVVMPDTATTTLLWVKENEAALKNAQSTWERVQASYAWRESPQNQNVDWTGLMSGNFDPKDLQQLQLDLITNESISKVEEMRMGYSAIAGDWESMAKMAISYDEVLTAIGDNNGSMEQLRSIVAGTSTEFNGVAMSVEEAELALVGLGETGKSLDAAMAQIASNMTLSMMQASMEVGGYTESEIDALTQYMVDAGMLSTAAAEQMKTDYIDAMQLAHALELDAKIGEILADTTQYENGLAIVNGKLVDAKTGKVLADISDFLAGMSEAELAQLDPKIVAILAELGPYLREILGIPDPPPKVVDITTNYIDEGHTPRMPTKVDVEVNYIDKGITKWQGPAGTTGREAVGGPVYPGQNYTWNESGREGEMLLTEKYGRVLSNHEVAQVMRDALSGGDGKSDSNKQVINNYNHAPVTINANVASDYDLDKLTREIVRRINA